MNPDKSSPGGDSATPSLPDRSIPLDQGRSTQAAAANVIRSQIDQLYGGRTALDTRAVEAVQPISDPQAIIHPQTQPADTNPYHRDHNPHPAPQADQWKEYHSAWQNYYQKYYEGYYTQAAASSTQAQNNHYFSSSAPQTTLVEETVEDLSNDEAIYELRQKLLGRVQDSANKVRGSRHFIPITAAIGVILLFIFLQYNSVFIANVAAYVSPGSIDPQNIVVDPSNDTVVSSEPRLIIPKINVDVPVLYDVGADYNSQMAAMAKGLAHFAIPGANSHPGEIGNTVIAGHSSNDLFDQGDYKFIFVQLEKLAPGDTVYANYQGKRYTYVVTKLDIVKPTDVSKLIYPTDKPVMTLITCTPIGTATSRLLVTAEQVSPDPTAAAAAPAGSGQADDTNSLPGNGPTLFERLFGIQ